MISFKILLVYALAILQIQCVVSNPNPAKLEPESYIVIGDRYYFFDSATRSWDEAAAKCESLGYKLVAFETEEEELLVREFMIAADYHNARWTSGVRVNSTQFKWSATDQLIGEDDFTYWGVNEPNNNGDCIVQTALYDWWDHPCNFPYRSICELYE